MEEKGAGVIAAGENAGEGAPRRDWNETAEEAAERVRRAASDVEHGVRRAKGEAARTLREGRERVAAAYDRTAESAGRLYRDARGYAKENPGTTAVVTFVAGIGVGIMLSGRNGYRARGHGLVPVVAVALANAVLEVFDPVR
jgi:ElaB/YqjD/DUF883 family membrane-anchored ribosome-binding protein